MTWCVRIQPGKGIRSRNIEYEVHTVCIVPIMIVVQSSKREPDDFILTSRYDDEIRHRSG